MRLLLVLLVAAGLSATSRAQVAPIPSTEDPRLQTIAYDPSRPVRLVAFPGATLTVMLVPGDQVGRVVVSDRDAFDIRVTGSNDSLNITSLRPDASATLVVETSQRRYELEVDTGQGLAAAYMVRFLPVAAPVMPVPPPMGVSEVAPVLVGEYRLSGDRALRPVSIGDDGVRTYIEWGKYQSLPAVFGIGPTGEEEVVDGYMRDGRFTIDRVYGELWFRIDKKRAKARRTEGLGTG